MVVITLPAFNEAQTLPSLLDSIRESMQENSIEYRVVVVDDGSTDGTAEAVRSMAQSMPITLVEHPENLGLGEAIRTGLLAALDDAERARKEHARTRAWRTSPPNMTPRCVPCGLRNTVANQPGRTCA